METAQDKVSPEELQQYREGESSQAGSSGGGQGGLPENGEHKRDCEINVRKLDLKTLHPVPLKPGGALFFSGMIPHETPPNRSDKRRRALQFHFRGSRSEILAGPEYDEIFQDAAGHPASCEAVRQEGV